MRYRFISEKEGKYSVHELCDILSVSRSGYYKWRSGEPSNREVEYALIEEEIKKVVGRANSDYGYRPVHSHLVENGVACGRDRTLRLMKGFGLSCKQSPRYKPLGTNSSHDYGFSPNLLKENGPPRQCAEVWVADTTYLSVDGVWVYLATVMDLFSRRILGWSISQSNDAELVCQALKAAKLTRGRLKKGIIHHSDRGSTYACNQYRAMLSRLDMLSSMSAKGNCYDNAAMESFFGRFKVGKIKNYTFTREEDLRAAVFEYIEPFYNRYRKHSSLGYESPVQFEKKFLPPMGGKGLAKLEDTFTNN